MVTLSDIAIPYASWCETGEHSQGFILSELIKRILLMNTLIFYKKLSIRNCTVIFPKLKKLWYTVLYGLKKLKTFSVLL